MVNSEFNTVNGLTGIHNEKIVFYVSMCKLLENSIMTLYKKINWSNVSYIDNITLDSFSSATIEGANTTLNNVKQKLESCEQCNKSEKMVLNCINAVKFIVSKENNIDNLMELWRIIIDGVCDNVACNGKRFRNKMVYIGNDVEVIHVPQSVDKLEDSVACLYRYIKNSNSIIDSIICHFYFVYIHPFCDGNGRTARILNSKILYDIGYKNMFKVPISNTILSNLNGYYRSLKESEETSSGVLNITSFVMYMLNVIKVTLETLVVDGGKIDSLEVKVYNLISKHSGAEITVKKCSKLLNISEYLARNTLNKMVYRGTLLRNKVGSTYYYSKNYLK